MEQRPGAWAVDGRRAYGCRVPASSPRRERPYRAALCCAAVATLLTACGTGLGDTAGALPADLADGASTAASGPSTSATADPSPTLDPGPLVTTPPDDHSEVGALASGFPTDLLPLPADAVLLVTSAVPVGGSEVQEVSLNLRTALATDEVLDLYRTALTAAGFTEVPADASGLSASASFVRSGADELVTVGVLDDGGARTVTVGGRLRTAEGS